MRDMLQFLGRGSAFADENNSAFFVYEDELVFIDCPMSSFTKIRHSGPDGLAGFGNAKITVAITHTHGDHAGGLATLIHYAFYALGRHVTVIAPSEEVKEDLRYLVGHLEGCDPAAYDIFTPEEAQRPWLLGSVPTRHTPELEGRCFGYRLLIGGNNVIYTGDTATIEPFLPYLTDGVYLYSDVSSVRNVVHIFVDDLLAQVRDLNIHLYLMHLDDFEAIMSAANGSGALPAPLYYGINDMTPKRR